MELFDAALKSKFHCFTAASPTHLPMLCCSFTTYYSLCEPLSCSFYMYYNCSTDNYLLLLTTILFLYEPDCSLEASSFWPVHCLIIHFCQTPVYTRIQPKLQKDRQADRNTDTQTDRHDQTLDQGDFFSKSIQASLVPQPTCC